MLKVTVFLVLVACVFATRLLTQPRGTTSCDLCVDFMGDATNELLNYILDGGVIGGCGDLCGKLPKKDEQITCNLICDYVGIKEFVKVINSTDPDPIYYCEDLHMCEHTENGAVTINSIQVVPPSGPQGTTFQIQVAYTVINATSTGQVIVEIVPPEGDPSQPFGGSELSTGQQPGEYAVGFQVVASPTEDEDFAPGAYTVEFAVCAGDCTTRHPYGGIYAVGQTTFNITESIAISA
eukprot:TRINITY_DN330_c0_g1_i1.p1 TRINITY_DN330_c0_g1~~TRINITY_DN330_c0_g1_i1.p1  ORF type:complete len:264 (+),score=54.15 TRINITY_DN330_c0_g1_i1:84-794(+)